MAQLNGKTIIDIGPGTPVCVRLPAGERAGICNGTFMRNGRLMVKVVTFPDPSDHSAGQPYWPVIHEVVDISKIIPPAIFTEGGVPLYLFPLSHETANSAQERLPLPEPKPEPKPMAAKAPVPAEPEAKPEQPDEEEGEAIPAPPAPTGPRPVLKKVPAAVKK